MTNTGDRIKERLDRTAGASCALEEVAIQSAQTTPIYTMYTQLNVLIFVPLRMQHLLNF